MACPARSADRGDARHARPHSADRERRHSRDRGRYNLPVRAAGPLEQSRGVGASRSRCTDGTAWPRAVEHPNQLDVTDRWTPIRENGFAVLDFFRERIEVALFRWNGQQQSVADIPALEPFAQIVLAPVN